MADDPAFLFYPGDYLRDTQCLSEKVQVAYDRIICEHMRNICISQQQLNFFTKRLSADEKSELMQVLAKVNGGFQIKWVAESIQKRRIYSDSRRKNREGKGKQSPQKEKNISNSYVPHMENEIVNDNVIEDNNKKEYDFSKPDIGGDQIVFPIDTQPARDLWAKWKEYRWREHGERYGMMGEQADLKRFNQKTFLQMEQSILAAIAGGWKNLYPESSKGNNNGTRVNGKAEQSASTSEYLNQYYSAKAKQQ